MPVITAMPRGITRDGARAGGEEIAANGARWTSRYGSVVTTVYGVGTADGMNERGFGAHLLYLENADFGERDLRKPAVGAHLWTQFLLDQAATVAEAVDLLDEVQIVMIAPSVLWVELDELDFSDSDRCLVIDPADISLAGDVTKAMAVAEPPF